MARKSSWLIRNSSMSTNSRRYRSASLRARTTSSDGSPGRGETSLAGSVDVAMCLRARGQRAEFEERHVERQHDRGDDEAHDHQERWFDQLDEPIDLGIDLLVVKLGEAVEHFLQGAGGLAHLHHLHGHIGKDP